MLDLAFSQISQRGAADAAIHETLHETIERVMAPLPSERQHPLTQQASRRAEAAQA